MKIQSEEWAKLRGLVSAHWFVPDPPRHRFYLRDDDLWGRLELSGPPDTKALILIQAAQAAPCVDLNALTLRLLAALDETPTILEAAEKELVIALRRRVEAEIAAFAAIDPFDAVVLRRNHVFINRSDLRPKVKRLLESDDSIALLVGGDVCGRSYTYEFLRNIAETHGIAVPRVRLNDVASAFEAIEALGLSLSTQSPPNVEDPDKRLRLGCRWLVQLARECSQDCWFVLDEYDQVGGQREFRDLVVRLATQIMEGSALSSHTRLVVLGFDEPLTRELRNAYSHDRTGHLTRSDVRAALRKIVSSPSAPAVDDATIDGLTEEIWSYAGGGGANGVDVTRMNERLEDAVRAILK